MIWYKCMVLLLCDSQDRERDMTKEGEKDK